MQLSTKWLFSQITPGKRLCLWHAEFFRTLSTYEVFVLHKAQACCCPSSCKKGTSLSQTSEEYHKAMCFQCNIYWGKKKKNPEYQKDQGPISADCSSKEVFSLQKFFQLFSPISFLIAFLFQNKYLKEANLRFRIISYGAQLL